MKIQKKQEIEFFGTKTGNANSIALGYATETKNFGEVAVGVMNKSTAAKDPNSSKGVCIDPDATLFSVGCGGSGERKNALEVKGDGSVIIPGENGNINIADKIKQAFDTDASIELVKSAEDSLQYTLMVNNESRGSINIPKDQFLKNVTYDSEGKQLVFTFITLDEDEHVERVPVGDLKDIYTAGEGITINGDNVISADFSSVMTAISDEKTLRETTDNEIKSTLDTKADKTDVNNRLDNLQNYCVKLEDNGGISFPFSDIISLNNNIKLFNSNSIDGHYIYADLLLALRIDEMQHCIYDKTSVKLIKIVKAENFDMTTESDFFRTVEPLDLTHTFYLDNEKTGIVENLTQLNIEASNVFVNLPYVAVDDNLDDDTTPQYIYDATDNKWIEVVETHHVSSYIAFNTEEPLDLTHELYYSNDTAIVNWTSVGEESISLGNSSSAEGYYSLAIGVNAKSRGDNSTAIGDSSKSIGYLSLAIGTSTSSKGDCSTALGSYSNAGGDYAIALGKNVSNTKSIFGVGFDGVNGIDMDRDNYGLYLKGFGGYDGTNLVVYNKGTETLNPNIKSVQEIINSKADVSAIPTKLSQLTNDSNFATPNDNAIFAGLTIHNNAQIKYIQKYHHEDEYTYLIAETPADRVANKVFAADGSLFDVGKVLKNASCGVSGNRDDLEIGITTVDNTYTYTLIPKVTKETPGIMTAADKVKLDKLQELVELKIVGTSESSVAMKPNKVYEITVGSALTITLEEPTDKTVYNEYQGTFDTGDTIPTVTFPSNVRWNDTPKVGANQHVEFSIRYSGGKYYGICQVWDITTEESV